MRLFVVMNPQKVTTKLNFFPSSTNLSMHSFCFLACSFNVLVHSH